MTRAFVSMAAPPLRMTHAFTRAAPFALLCILALACGSDSSTEPSEDPLAVAPQGPFAAGTSYLGRSGYVEYIAGNLPLIISAPHGGTLAPTEIPDRVAGQCGGEATTVRDTNTEELAREIARAFYSATGKYPHVVINRLHRRKLDANRAVQEAACGVDPAIVAFKEFHAYIDSARTRVTSDFGRGWYTDLHGHGHVVARLELGYRISAAELRLSDAELNASTAIESRSTIRTFSQTSPLSFSALLRGPTSLGSLFQAEGFRSVPSAQDVAPLAGEEFFSGGHNVETWACSAGGALCGVQIEANFIGVRDTAANRAAFAAALVRVYGMFLRQNFGIELAVR